MKTSNLASQNLRVAETGLVLEEKLSGAMGTLEVLKVSTIRVRALGATTVTLDGVLACTMVAGEIILLNAGEGNQSDPKATVTVVIAGAAAFVQVAREVNRPRS